MGHVFAPKWRFFRGVGSRTLPWSTHTFTVAGVWVLRFVKVGLKRQVKQGGDVVEVEVWVDNPHVMRVTYQLQSAAVMRLDAWR